MTERLSDQDHNDLAARAVWKALPERVRNSIAETMSASDRNALGGSIIRAQRIIDRRS